MGTSEGLEDDFDQTLTVTISLDSEYARAETDKAADSFDDHIEQPSASKFLDSVDPEIRISQLPDPVIRILGRRLNPPAIGSMRNWEYVAMLLGLSLDEITLFRITSNPVERVLSECQDVPFNTFLHAIADSNRIDVLISLRPHLRHLHANLVERPNNNTRLESLALNQQPIDNRAVAGPSRVQRSLPSRFILVTHHEPPKNDRSATMSTVDSAIDLPSRSDGRQHVGETSPHRSFKHLWKNLKGWGEAADIQVLDIEKCIDETNAVASLYEHFNRATQIVLVASKAYHDEICNSKAQAVNTRVDLKRRLNSFMDQEFFKNGANNHRFRVIIFDLNDRQFLPLGWASSTIEYLFPEQHVEIGKRLFENQ